jgi:hypothetical protein
VIDQLRAAAEALNSGDPEPFAALIADENEWRGIADEHGTPSCHGPNEARAVLQTSFARRRGVQIQPTFEQIGDRIIGSTTWVDDDGSTVERFQVLTIRDGKIVDMQGCASRGEAERFARG